MADRRIDQLTDIGSVVSTDLLAVYDVSTLDTRKATPLQVKAALALTKSDVGLANVDNTSDANKPVSTATQAELNLKQDSLTAFNNALFYQVAPNNIQGIPNWAINPLQGLTQTPQITVTAGFGESINSWIAHIDHDIVSLDKNYQMHYNRINTDVTDTGNAVGTNGLYASFVTNDFFHDKESDIGEIAFISNSFTIGLNGANPIEANGFSYAYGFGQVRDNVTIKGSMQGYGFQPSFDTGSLVDVNANLTAFYDFTNAPNTVFSSYVGMNLSPIIGGIQNNRNMQSININPNTGNLLGNAGYTGVGIVGTFGNIGTNGYQGINVSPTIGLVANANLINVNPTITSSTDVVGLDVNMSNVVGTNVLAARFNGDVQINGDLNFTGALSIGQLSAFAQQNIIDSGFNPVTVHGLISSVTGVANTTVANADLIGVNTASLMEFNTNSVLTSGPFGIGACALALPAVVTTETGSNTQHVRAAVFALNLDAGATGGTIQNLVGCRSTAIPNGVTTVNKFIAYEADLSFGDVTSGDSFGFFSSAEVHNYFRGSVCVGGTQEKVTNSSVGLEVASTTKAILNPRMTTVERDALTAVDGMQIYNTSTNVFQTRSGGLWVDHTGAASTSLIVTMLPSGLTTTSAALVNTQLFFEIGANETWQFEFHIQHGCNNTGGMRFNLETPTGSDHRTRVTTLTTANTAFASQILTTNSETVIATNSVNSAGQGTELKGLVVNGATAGEVRLRYRSFVSGQLSSIYKESYLVARRIS